MALAPAHVPQPAWRLWYLRQDITAEITAYTLDVTFSDKLEKHAGEISFSLEDSSGRWQQTPPTRGDKVQLSIGYDDNLVPCGLFEIDEIEVQGPGDKISMKGIAAAIGTSLRTHYSRAYESQSLAQIAGTVAAAHGLTVVGAPEDPGVVSFERVTQKHETDLGFLYRLANLHNYTFAVKGSQLVFTARKALEQAATVLTITRSPMLRFAFTSKTGGVHKSATVSYHDPATKTLITGSADADPPVPTGDELKLPMRAENEADAKAKAKAALHAANMGEVTCSLSLYGDERLLSGLNVMLQGWGWFDGVYLVETSSHKLTRGGGYTTDITGRRKRGQSDG